MALGQTIVIISGGIDISVGSIMGLSAMVTALVLEEFPRQRPGWQVVPLGIGISVGVGLICGLINGSLVVGLRMHPFIVTLATLSIFRWGCLKIGTLYGSSLPWGDKEIPEGFAGHFIAWEVPYARYGGRVTESLQFTPMLIMLAIVLIGWMYLRHTIWGRETYAIGGNEEAARYSGIRVRWAKLRVYMISGACAGIAGMITCGFYKSASTNTGEGYELNVIAAAVVGGASLTGGRGTALGAVLGMLVLALIEDGISVLGRINLGFTTVSVVKEDQKLIMGLAIIAAVAVDQLSMYLQQLRSSRALARAQLRKDRFDFFFGGIYMRIGSILLAVAACLSLASGAFAQAKPKIILGIVAKSQSNPVFQAAHQGAKDAAKELGPQYGVDVEIDIQTPPDEDAQKQGAGRGATGASGAVGIAVSCFQRQYAGPGDRQGRRGGRGGHVFRFRLAQVQALRLLRHGRHHLRQAGGAQELAKSMGDKGKCGEPGGQPGGSESAKSREGRQG